MYSFEDLSLDTLANVTSVEESVMNPADEFFRLYTEADSTTVTNSDGLDVKLKKVDSGFLAKVKMGIKKLVESVLEFINDKIDSLKQSVLEKEFDKLVKDFDRIKGDAAKSPTDIKVINYKDINDMVDTLEKYAIGIEGNISDLVKETDLDELSDIADNTVYAIEKKVDEIVDKTIVYDKTINLNYAAALATSQMLYRKALTQNKFKIDYNYIDKLEYSLQVSTYTALVKLQMRIRKEIMKLLYSSTKSMISAIRTALKNVSSVVNKDTLDDNNKALDDADKLSKKARALNESYYLASELAEDIVFESSEDEFADDAFLQYNFGE